MVFISETRPGRPKTSRATLFDKNLELRAPAAAALTASGINTGVQFPARQQMAFKAVFDYTSTIAGGTSTDAVWTLAIAVATASATTATGTTVASIALPHATATGVRELYIGGSQVEEAIGDIASKAEPVFIRCAATLAGTSAATLDYNAYLTIAN